MTKKDCSLKVLLALYENEVLKEVIESGDIIVSSGETMTLNEISTDKIGTVTEENITGIKIFVWNGIDNMNPLCGSDYVMKEE